MMLTLTCIGMATYEVQHERKLWSSTCWDDKSNRSARRSHGSEVIAEKIEKSNKNYMQVKRDKNQNAERKQTP